MKTSTRVAFVRRAALAAYLCLGFGQIAVAQYSAGSPPARQDRGISAQEQRERGIARCSENRGVDCDKPEGQKEWINQERPITDEQRINAAARRAREAREAHDASRRR